jgi:hypothetical protein
VSSLFEFQGVQMLQDPAPITLKVSGGSSRCTLEDDRDCAKQVRVRDTVAGGRWPMAAPGGIVV